jgi:hypothetical protein
MTTRSGLRITPGEIRVSGYVTVLDEPSVRAWHVDLDSKYAEVLAYSEDEVLLIAGERTLGVDEDNRGTATSLTINLPEGWNVIVDCSRYTCRIIGYRWAEVR